jgi:hypothetical protein
MTTIGTAAAWIALGLVAARVVHRSVLRYRCAQLINEVAVRGPRRSDHPERQR